jgi:hypothetical protein
MDDVRVGEVFFADESPLIHDVQNFSRIEDLFADETRETLHMEYL